MYNSAFTVHGFWEGIEYIALGRLGEGGSVYQDIGNSNLCWVKALQVWPFGGEGVRSTSKYLFKRPLYSIRKMNSLVPPGWTLANQCLIVETSGEELDRLLPLGRDFSNSSKFRSKGGRISEPPLSHA